MREGFAATSVACTIVSSSANPNGDRDVILVPGQRRKLAKAIDMGKRLLGLKLNAYAGATAGAVSGLAKRGRCDLVEMEESFGIAREVQRLVNIPVVVRLHGPWFLNGGADGRAEDAAFCDRVRQEGEAIRDAVAVTAPSLDVLERTRSYYGLSIADAVVIPNPAPSVCEGQRWCLDRSDGRMILFVGRFDRHKGGDLMIRSFASLAGRYPDARLVFVGPDRGLLDVDRRWSLPEFIQSYAAEYSDRIGVLGQQTPDRIRLLRQRARVCVVASRFETFSLVCAEAASAGCPLVATSVGGIPEVVQHERNGLLARPEDPEDLADKIGRLLEDNALCVRLGRQAAIDAEERYAPERIARQTLEFYGKVIERWRAPVT